MPDAGSWPDYLTTTTRNSAEWYQQEARRLRGVVRDLESTVQKLEAENVALHNDLVDERRELRDVA